MTSVITRGLVECQIDRFNIADRLYTFWAPIFLPWVHPNTYHKHLCLKNIAGRGSKKRLIYRVMGDPKMRADTLLWKEISQTQQIDITRCYSSLCNSLVSVTTAVSVVRTYSCSPITAAGSEQTCRGTQINRDD